MVLPKYQSHIQLGDERKKGVEKEWDPKYCKWVAGQNSHYARKKDAVMPCDRLWENLPVFSENGREMTLEEVLAAKINAKRNGGSGTVFKLFTLMDKDATGTIGKEELGEFLTHFAIRLSTEQLEQVITRYDADGDGEVDYFEFMHGVFPDEFPQEDKHKFVRTPRNAVSFGLGPCFIKNGRNVTLDVILTDKIEAKWRQYPHECRKLLQSLDPQGTGNIGKEGFNYFLWQFHINLSSAELDTVMTQYGGTAPPGTINIKSFLKRFFPEDFAFMYRAVQ